MPVEFWIGYLMGIAVLIFLVREVMWRWFGIRRAIRALESIAESLEQLPAAREHRDRLNQPRRRSA